MIALRRIAIAAVIGALFMATPLAALADGGETEDVSRTTALISVDDAVAGTNIAADNGATSKERVTDRRLTDSSDHVRPTDERPTDRRVTDRGDRVRPTDERPVRRCAVAADNPRRCIADHPTDIDYRHLLWRLFKAHEWEKLIRLLEHLGLI